MSFCWVRLSPPQREKNHDRHARKSCLDARSRLPILQVEQPFDERLLARGGLVITELHNDCNL
jgi:hypothetical protein